MFTDEILKTIFNPVHANYVFHLAIASVLGAIIGLERDMHGRAAGLRTHLLVSLGSALFTIVSVEITRHATSLSTNGAIPDPGRIAAQVVTGIGFIGGGAILKDGVTVRGLTTAACLWVTAAVGICAGIGLYSTAAVTTLMAVFCLTSLNRFEGIYRKDHYRSLSLRLSPPVPIESIVKVLQRKNLKVLNVDFTRNYDKDELDVTIVLRLLHRGLTFESSEEIANDLHESKLPLKRVRWSH